MNVLAAAVHQEPNEGWGKLVALLVAVGLFWAGTSIYERYLAVKADPDSPTPEGVALEGVKPQINGPTDPNVTPSAAVAVKADPDLDEFVKRNVGRMRRADIIRAGKAQFRKSESTIKRAYKRAKEPKK